MKFDVIMNNSEKERLRLLSYQKKMKDKRRKGGQR